MFWYTRAGAKKIDSGALMADAWHHRSDALSSIGALVGIAGARMGYPILDAIASLVICIFIEKAAIDIFKDAINKMVDKACDDETEHEMYECVMKMKVFVVWICSGRGHLVIKYMLILKSVWMAN